MANRLSGLQLQVASLVDAPAQEHATVRLVKDKDGKTVPAHAAPVGKGWVPDEDCAPLLTSESDGHQHMVNFAPDAVGGNTDWASMADEDGDTSQHSHPWVMQDGKIVIGSQVGHTHEVEVPLVEMNAAVAAVTTAVTEMAAGAIAAVTEAVAAESVSAHAPASKSAPGANVANGKTDAYNDRVDRNTENADMDKDQQIIALKNELAATAVKHATELAHVKAAASMTDDERAHAGTIADVGERDAFVAKSAPERQAIAKAAIIHTTSDGTVFRKGQEQMVALIKSNDALLAQVEVEKGKTEELTLTKAVGEAIPVLKGTDRAKLAVMKFAAGVADPVLKTEITELLKAANNTVRLVTKASGVTPSTKKKDATAGTGGEAAVGETDTPRAKLKRYVTTKAAEMKVSYAVALSKLGDDETVADLMEQIQDDPDEAGDPNEDDDDDEDAED